MTTPDANKVLDEFCIVCERVWMDHELYLSVCEADPRTTLYLFNSVAPKYFHDINRILVEHLLLQFSKIIDPAKTRSDANLTTNYILKELNWPDDVREKLRDVNERLQTFRDYIIPARSKRLAHVDLTAQIEQTEALGKFPEGADKQFLRDLQEFINIAHGHLHNGEPRPIDIAMATDTDRLVKALEKSLLYDRCQKCDMRQRAWAALDFRRQQAGRA